MANVQTTRFHLHPCRFLVVVRRQPQTQDKLVVSTQVLDLCHSRQARVALDSHLAHPTMRRRSLKLAVCLAQRRPATPVRIRSLIHHRTTTQL